MTNADEDMKTVNEANEGVEDDEQNNDDEQEEDQESGEEEEMMDEKQTDEISEEQIAALQAEVSANPNDYNKNMELITLLRGAGELEALRTQRESTSRRFAMPPKFWMEWIDDEKTCESERDLIESIFDRAIKDFHSPDVIIEYVQWACGVSIEFARKKMDEAIGLIGLRADCASTIWNVYLDFEKMILRSLSGEQAEKHHLLIDGIYARFLRIPHLGLEETWSDYQAFADGQVSELAKSNYQSALKRMRDIVPFEQKLSGDDLDTDDEKLSVQQQLIILSEYVQMEMQRHSPDPARIQMMFERALVVSASEPDANLWLQYGAWLDSSLKIPSVSVGVYERAIRHAECTALWQQYLSALERAGCAAEMIDSKWPQAKETICSADEGLSLYRTYIYLLRRRASTQGGGDHSKVLELFEEGAEFLAERFGPHWDSPKAQYRKNYALFLYTIAKLPEKGRKVWNEILASGSGHLAAAWLEATNLERFFGKTETARKFLYRAINSASDHPYTVYEALIQFEREVGTLEDLDRALEKVNAQAARVAARPQKIKKPTERETDAIVHGVAETNETSPRAQKSQQGANKREKSAQKRTHENDTGTGEKQPAEQEKRARTVIDEDGFTVPTMPAIAPKKKPIKQERCSTDRAVKKPGETGSEAASIPSSSRNGTDGSGVAGRSAIAKNGSSEGNTTAGAAAEKTVFISNLDFKLPKERIMEVFPNAKEVRFIHRGMSKLHKGFGYVDFETVEEACAALSKDRHLIDGRPMYVSENRPHEHRGEHSEFRYATNLEKNKIFVGNVHYDATEEQLKEVFTAYGVIRDVRIVTHKSGRSKGFAYIEFEDEASASAAVKAATEEIVLLERKLSVALSNPPKKKDPMAAAAAPSRIASSSVSHQRNKIDLLVPRALARSKPETNSSKSTAHQGSEETNKGGVEDQQKESGKPIATKLSNDQFRSMFSK